jgi:hypothetical protein
MNEQIQAAYKLDEFLEEDKPIAAEFIKFYNNAKTTAEKLIWADCISPYVKKYYANALFNVTDDVREAIIDNAEFRIIPTDTEELNEQIDEKAANLIVEELKRNAEEKKQTAELMARAIINEFAGDKSLVYTTYAEVIATVRGQMAKMNNHEQHELYVEIINVLEARLEEYKRGTVKTLTKAIEKLTQETPVVSETA